MAFTSGRNSDAVKIPQHILMRDGEPFALAGLWETWRDSAAAPDAIRGRLKKSIWVGGRQLPR